MNVAYSRRVPIARPAVPSEPPAGVLDVADQSLLVAILAQLSGDRRWLGEPFRSALGAREGASGGLVEIEGAGDRSAASQAGAKAEVHRALLVELERFDPAATPLPDDDLLAEAVRFVTGAELDSGYTRYLRAALTPDPQATDAVLADGAVAPRVVIIGAGLCGLTMAIRLRRLGLPFVLVERHDEVGGVWLENSYPRCGVDSPNHGYSFSDALNPDWSRHYAKRPEILDYIRRTAAETGVVEHIRFGCDARLLRWSEKDRHWELHLHTAAGEELLVADIVIPAVGTLNQPKEPAIPGIERFAGPVFHTARWRHDVELVGKRIGLIGNGSSGFQVGPHLADIADHLVSFQRSPAWAVGNPRTNAPMDSSSRWLFSHLPFYAEWYRFALYWSSGDAGYTNLLVDPTWAGPGVSAQNEAVRRHLTDYLRSQVGDREDLVGKLLPAYPPFTKRMVIDNGWFAALARPNVALVTEPIVEATGEGPVTGDGVHHQLDVIVHATGFHGTRFLWPTEVRGRSGRTPAELSGANDDIRAYLGTALVDFPNLFAVFGPNASIGHGGSAIHVAECQADYIAALIVAMATEGIRVAEVRKEVSSRYNAQLDADMTRMVWSEPGVRSRYRNAEGRIVTNHPWTIQRFWELTRTPDLSDYHLER